MTALVRLLMRCNRCDCCWWRNHTSIYGGFEKLSAECAKNSELKLATEAESNFFLMLDAPFLSLQRNVCSEATARISKNFFLSKALIEFRDQFLLDLTKRPWRQDLTLMGWLSFALKAGIHFLFDLHTQLAYGRAGSLVQSVTSYSVAEELWKKAYLWAGTYPGDKGGAIILP